MDKTIEYYETNAERFAETTKEVAFAETQDRFLKYLPDGGRILDFGCGSGRDSKYFIKKGYQVDAIDGSEKLCEIASRVAGITVRHMYFSELDAENEYDGIWACASILHLPQDELLAVFGRMERALKPGGYLYSSFKYGEYEGERNGRYFTDFSSDSFHKFSNQVPDLVIVEEWITSDVRPGRGDEKWLNLILQKSGTI